MCEPGLHDHKHKHKHNVHVVSNGVIFPQISFNIVPYALHFLSIKLFPQVHYLNKLCIQLLQNVTWTDE